MKGKTIALSVLALAVSAELHAQADELEVTLEVLDDVSEIDARVRHAYAHFPGAG